jgi:hypothetical protein
MGLVVGEPGIMQGLSIPGVLTGPLPGAMELATGQLLRTLLAHDCMIEPPTAFMLFIILLFLTMKHKEKQITIQTQILITGSHSFGDSDARQLHVTVMSCYVFHFSKIIRTLLF